MTILYLTRISGRYAPNSSSSKGGLVGALRPGWGLQPHTISPPWILRFSKDKFSNLGGFWHGGCPRDISRKLHFNFQVSTILGNAPSPMCLQGFIMETRRTLEVPERSLGGFWHGGCLKDTSMKLHISFQISTFLGSAPSPMCLQSVNIESKRTQVGSWRCLGGVGHTGCPKNTSIFRYLPVSYTHLTLPTKRIV